MTLLPVLVGLPLGVLLSWISECAPALAAKGTQNSVRDDLSRPRPDGDRRRCSTTMAEFRPDWRDIGILIATSGLLALLDVRFDPFWDHLPTVIAVLFFLLVAIVDLKHRLVLNAMVLPASGFVLLARMMDSGESLVPTLLGAGVGLFPFLLTALAKPGSMGGGDVKLAALIGLALGFPEVLWAISLGILGGGIVSIVFLLSRRFQASDHLPYAPFLCLGAITALLYDPLTPLLLSMAR